MPVTSFVCYPTIYWRPAPKPRKRPKVQAHAPKKKPTRTARDSELIPRWQAVAEVWDDLNAALAAAVKARVIDVLYEDRPADSIAITSGEYELLERILHGQGPPPAADPSDRPPGSAERILTYLGRVARGEAVLSDRDAKAGNRGLDVTGTGRGANLKTEVHDWADDE
jgi:hypothetical protein